ncbi:Major allergen Pru ar 1 [Vitis vinifera]|uniref:Major allergen Pru ar 1 n=1 Tax=Vitis vinifera TaxID=29760 RepID=A0A438DX71_VITVI|nr:Major allergen Pru ar 1 [Vitis vinifera]
MGVITYEMEITSPIPPAKMFKAFVLDSDNLIPKICLRLSSVLKPLKEVEGSQFNYIKHRIDGINKENFTYSYSVIEGDALIGTLESFSYEVKLVEDPSARTPVNTTPKGTLRSQKTRSRLSKRRPWACTRLLKPTSWQILMPIKQSGPYSI